MTSHSDHVITGAQINTVLRAAKAATGTDRGNEELSVLVFALVAACQEFGISHDELLLHVSNTYGQLLSADRVPLSREGMT